MPLDKLIEGNNFFINQKFPAIEDDLQNLVKYGQHPEVMFIGCCDSRVTPDLMLDTKPGDMFILRNVGNFVPPFKYDVDFHGSAAAIEYAIAVLKVKHIIVCGHSHCGACKSLYDEIPNNDSFVHVRTWLKLGEKPKEMTLKEKKFTTPREMIEQTERNSIKFQLENLMTYPDVERLSNEGTLQIHGWYYNIATGGIEYYDKISDQYKPLSEFKYEKSK